MPTTPPSDDPPGSSAPVPAVPASPPHVDALDGELISAEEYRHTRLQRALPTAVTALPARWRRATERNPGLRAVAATAEASGSLGGAVGYGLVVTLRAWWKWVRVRDLYDAAQAIDKLADRYSEIHGHRSRRRWWTVGAVGAGATALVVADRFWGPAVWWYTSAAAAAALAGQGAARTRHPVAAACSPVA
ncbi:Cell divisionFtsK/SpoIIIE protein [Alloactinosynnema sp. L-07]|uniref:hypothetical protein n=1 Tax=Alloactinosynnema sp. L-07 TaxID=1653480 RepID=UPI00065EFF84|nr:hypothetical protein [Alloactinosynnema sp. L-07]CRK56963.1 Cell divisionFtsK/SpoIIIE protein [Alloactinosynnema sp. L-07]